MRAHYEIFKPGSYRLPIVKRDVKTGETFNMWHDFTSRKVALAALAIWNQMSPDKWQYRERYI